MSCWCVEQQSAGSAQQPSSYVASVSAGSREHWDGDGDIAVIRSSANTPWTLEQELREQGHRQHVVS